MARTKSLRMLVETRKQRQITLPKELEDGDAWRDGMLLVMRHKGGDVFALEVWNTIELPTAST